MIFYRFRQWCFFSRLISAPSFRLLAPDYFCWPKHSQHHILSQYHHYNIFCSIFWNIFNRLILKEIYWKKYLWQSQRRINPSFFSDWKMLVSHGERLDRDWMVKTKSMVEAWRNTGSDWLMDEAITGCSVTPSPTKAWESRIVSRLVSQERAKCEWAFTHISWLSLRSLKGCGNPRRKHNRARIDGLPRQPYGLPRNDSEKMRKFSL